MKNENTPVLSTKRKDQVPFKSELIGKDVSYKLLMAAGNTKTYRQVIRDCDEPEVLREILILKRNEPHFPGLGKITRIAKYASFAASVTALFKGKQLAVKVKCLVYRVYLPKKQYTDAL